MLRGNERPPAFALVLLLVIVSVATDAFGQQRVPTPASVIGHEVGADYKLARWETIVDYFDRLGETSDRVNVRRMGSSTEGNPYLLCEISNSKTVRELDRYRQMQAKLADPRLVEDDDDRKRLLRDAKTTVMVTCALHSNECAGSQMAMELAYNLATRDDAVTREILDQCIILLVPSANPDGNNKIIDWYERYLGTPFEGGRMPWLYHTYAGHDTNRDWYMLNLKETRILTEVLYHEWYPTILYDVHQMGNRGARFFVPPFFDPVNPNVDPLIHQSLLIIGGHMATALQEQGKTGVVFKAIFDNWWAGGNRTTPYRHNIVGILTEAASAKIASPIFQEYDDLSGGGRGFPQYAPAVNFPKPWPGGWWRLRDVVDYELIACESLFTLAARYRDRFVRNHLTLSEQAIAAGANEPPYAWVVPAEQRDPGAAADMLTILRLTGIEVYMAAESFVADGATYPRGSHVLLAAQPFRPHLKDMMERQQYPERRAYPGGPAESPYDSAGWTLPLQMGVRAVTVVQPFEAELSQVDNVEATRVVPTPTALPAGFVTMRRGNADYTAVNALLADGFEVSVLQEAHDALPVGSIVVDAKDRVADLILKVQELTRRVPARLDVIERLPPSDVRSRMVAPRTALYQPWTASMDEGWTRYALERFEFPYTTIHNAEIRAGSLRERYDCIIIPDMRIERLMEGISDKRMPPPYAGGIGEDGAMALERFVRRGGTLVLLDSATELATDVLRVPVRNTVTDLPRNEFFCPGSLVRVRIDQDHPLGYGLPDEVAGYFARSCAFVTGKSALQSASDDFKKANEAKGTATEREYTAEEIETRIAAQPVTSAATYADNIVLLSGWLLGEEFLRGRSAVCEVQLGEGRIVLLGFRVQHRAQPHGTFKLLFNSIYRATLAERPD